MQDRLDDHLIPGTAADVRIHIRANLFPSRIRVLCEQALCQQDHSGSTKTALETAALAKSLLKRMQAIWTFQTFDRSQVFAVKLKSKQRTGANGFSIQ